MKKTILLSAVTMLFALTTMAKDIKTVVFTTNPQMHCENCENKIKNNVRFVKGVKSIETNVEKQTVTIKYDADKTSTEKIKEGFTKIGYSVEELNGEKKPECKQEGKCCKQEAKCCNKGESCCKK